MMLYTIVMLNVKFVYCICIFQLLLYSSFINYNLICELYLSSAFIFLCNVYYDISKIMHDIHSTCFTIVSCSFFVFSVHFVVFISL